MDTFSWKKVAGTIIILVVLLVLALWLWPSKKDSNPVVNYTPNISVVGKSVQGREIQAYKFGTGNNSLVLVGGIHGGYEWNSVLLAYQAIDYLSANPSVVPSSLSVIIIPSANPDGVYKVIGKEGRFVAENSPDREVSKPGRFNAHGVDLNRNFDCHWKPKAVWQNKVVSAGTAPFSEPEAVALKDYFLTTKPSAVVFWHSQSNGIYASACDKGILPITSEIMNIYSQASGYPVYKTFDSYEVTGAAEDWLASINIPAITVELKTHETIEWDKNLPAILALIKRFGQ